MGEYGPGYHAGKTGGLLKKSWTLTFPSPTEAVISTNLVYAPDNEYGIRGADGAPYRQRSSIGGRGSVRMTRNGIQALVDSEVRKLT